jgi:hypothetical protein
MGWLDRFRVLSPKAGGTKTAQVAEATPIRVLSRIRLRQTVVIPESHNAAAW